MERMSAGSMTYVIATLLIVNVFSVFALSFFLSRFDMFKSQCTNNRGNIRTILNWKGNAAYAVFVTVLFTIVISLQLGSSYF